MTKDYQNTLLNLRSGNRLAIKSIYEESFNYCASIILNNHGQVDDARDIFQEALMVLIRQSAKPDFELTCSIKTYLYSVVRNLWLKHLAKQRRSGLHLSIDEESSREVLTFEDELEDKIENEKKHDMIKVAIQEISSDCRELLIDFYFKKFDLGTIAEKMEYTYAFIKVKKNRCMNALKKKVMILYGEN